MLCALNQTLETHAITISSTDKFINLDGEVLDWLGIMQKEIQSSHTAPDWRALVMSPPGSERDQ